MTINFFSKFRAYSNSISIRKKLFVGKIFIVFLLFIIVLTSIISISNLSKTASKMEVEYTEVNVVQELQISFQEMISALKSFIISGEKSEMVNFRKKFTQTKLKIAENKRIISRNHNKNRLANFEKDFDRVNSLAHKLFKLDISKDNLTRQFIMDDLTLISNSAMFELKDISKETEMEMKNYIEEDRNTNSLGKLLVILTGLMAAILMLTFSYLLLNDIVTPLNSLVNTTKNISLGKGKLNTEITSKDEIGNLVDSFNNMISVLESTTVSRDYFDNILDRMDDSLIITDNENIISVVNKATLNLLVCTKEDIVGKNFKEVLGERIDSNAYSKNNIIKDLMRLKHLNNIYNIYYSKDGNKIPVLFSGSIIYNIDGSPKGMIYIANFSQIQNKNEVDYDDENKPSIIENEFQNIKTNNEIPLTKREKEIMKLIAEEKGNQEIAEKLFISVRTVETHRKNIMLKLHTKSVISLVKYAALNGII
ncbi:MAG: hypothetical protein AUJ98_03870 [Bacteroidetes bacterium CG2_30_33_31]|nr:MAG: hypothetical protein AUJ98_03870 [Bacteroidetes bacterium CG2_30_33_31]